LSFYYYFVVGIIVTWMNRGEFWIPSNWCITADCCMHIPRQDLDIQHELSLSLLCLRVRVLIVEHSYCSVIIVVFEGRVLIVEHSYCSVIIVVFEGRVLIVEHSYCSVVLVVFEGRVLIVEHSYCSNVNWYILYFFVCMIFRFTHVKLGIRFGIH
jgi:hypothetical protein